MNKGEIRKYLLHARFFTLTIIFFCSSAFCQDKAETVGPQTQKDSDTNFIFLARDALARAQPEKALRILGRHIPSSADQQEYFFLTGRAYQDLKRNINAIEQYTLSIYLNPKDARPYINRALVKGALQDLAGAEKDLSLAISIDPSNEVAYMNRGVTLAGMNKLSQAISDFDRSIKLEDRYSDAFLNRGIAYQLMGDSKAACHDWSQAARLGSAEARSLTAQLCAVNTKQ